jgi:aspartate-semialdehyde dehydrogenase
MSTFHTSGAVVGIAGATGAVGIEVISVLARRGFAVKQLRLFASARSAGKTLETEYGPQVVEEFSVAKSRECDFVFLAVSGDFALEYAKAISEGDGPIVIDNSSAFRYFPEIPLVVPEINAHALAGNKLIANPNCTTAIAAVVLWPLHQKFGIKKLIMSTYQAASGAGAEGMEELQIGTLAKLSGQPVVNSVFVHPLPLNLIPHIDKFQPNGYTKEEMKVVWETIKIFGLSEDLIKVSCTAVRIPTMRAHSEAITIETEKPITADEARTLLALAPGVKLVDDISATPPVYPMPLTATSQFDVEVGRIRESLVFAPHGLDLFVSGDQLLRGAALNAVLIAEKCLEMSGK